MKHLYITLYYSRFKLIPVRVIWTKLIIVKSLILIIITTINDYFIYIYTYTFFMYGSACGCVRQYVYQRVSPHLLPSMYDFMIDQFPSSLDISDVHTMK